MQRQKSFLKQFFGLWGWLAIGALGLGTVFVVLAVIGTRNADRLTAHGADATATITDKRRVTDNDGTDYRLSYRFTVGDETIEDRQDVSYLFYQRFSEGEQLPVRYWTGDPSLSEVEAGDASAMGWIGTIGTAFCGGLALIFGGKAWARASHARWMGRHGVRRSVTVTGHTETSVTINDARQWTATWAEGGGRAGATRMTTRDRLPGVGSSITILVDPDHRRPSVWEDDLLA